MLSSAQLTFVPFCFLVCRVEIRNDAWGGHVSSGKRTQQELSLASSWSRGLSIVQVALVR